ncbi:Signal transducer and activator of transcription 1 [Labeo rohita]|uniref:Signal transducer and activator of transcription 1 n=1 Tax=Labeo rohita TaxID=84645 RepID=A0ABQ8MFA6_LABRO|nr:Signal transducer and activator of transcription 1 [Labeo rohita]
MGELVNLAERAQSTDLVSSLLKERESYIPLRVSRGEGREEILRKLSNPSKERDKRGGASKRGGVSQSRIKAAINFKKAITTPRS